MSSRHYLYSYSLNTEHTCIQIHTKYIIFKDRLIKKIHTKYIIFKDILILQRKCGPGFSFETSKLSGTDKIIIESNMKCVHIN